jgi:hypothetical protein
LAAQSNQLNAVDATAVLRAIRRMQVLDNGSMHGCLRWYWEEGWPRDQNASFFTGLSLIALDRCYREQLDAGQRATLREILTDLGRYAVKESTERDFYYPNRCLGDLVCAWLIREIITPADAPIDPDGQRRQIMLDAAAYWTTNGWGWGEHLSDIYADVCLDELSLLLLLSNRLPPDVRASYKALFDQLLALDDSFGGLPRVPTLRSYAFDRSPTQVSYRDRIRPLEKGVSLAGRATPPMPPELGGVFQHHPPLGATLYARGWHSMAPPRQPPRKDVVIPCFGGAVARARVEPDVRLGSVSRFPLMPLAEKPTSGMAWQGFPVALWRPDGGWGFLQWQSRSGERIRAHPALDIMTGYRDQALTTPSTKLTFGQTCTIQRGGDVIALRVMPAVASEWDQLSDRFRFVGAPADLAIQHDDRSLLLRFPQRDISVRCLPLSVGGTVTFDEVNGAATRTIDWGPRFDRDSLSGLKTVLVLWGVSINGRIAEDPVIERVAPTPSADDRAPEEQPLEIRWSWPNTNWRLKIDPRAARPLDQIAEVTPESDRPLRP